MAQRRRRSVKTPLADVEPAELRIIGGKWRRQILQYSGDKRTRPMKDRVREAVFNLVGDDVRGAHAIDLFAGTGALGLEALSRGAARATLIERHLPTARLIEQNVAALGAEQAAEVLSTSAFVWGKRHEALPAQTPWLVLCSPPFDFFVQRRDEMLELVTQLWREAPPGSVFVLEADERFDFAGLPAEGEWDVRAYLPAVVGVGRK
jgi:16S rRNA (guanine(966)-N(2))-methyltransferase RsmD